MINDSNKEELIEQYCLGELNGIQLEEFNQMLTNDDQLRKDVMLQADIIRNIQLAGRQKWASKLKSLHEGMNSAETKKETLAAKADNIVPFKRWPEKKYLLVAATFIGIIVMSGLLFLEFKTSSLDTEKIFLSYYQPYVNLEEGNRALPMDTLTERRQAIMAYSQKNYPASIRLFESILKKGEDEVVLFYLGNAYLSNNMPKEAANTFRKYLARFKEYDVEARWYLGLSYLKENKLKEARKVLEELAKEKNDFSNRASALLKTI